MEGISWVVVFWTSGSVTKNTTYVMFFLLSPSGRMEGGKLGPAEESALGLESNLIFTRFDLPPGNPFFFISCLEYAPESYQP